MRIKTDQGCGGMVTEVVYENMYCFNVSETIDLDMFYATSSNPTTLKISNILFKNITANKSGKPGEFACTSDSPCEDIQLQSITHTNTPGSWYCENAHGTASNVSPPSCLLP